MRTVFILHGIYGSPEENWFPWMRRELESSGLDVLVPQFPTREPRTTLEDWEAAWQEHADRLAEDSIVIGHSLGAAFALTLVERASVGGVFLVAPAWGKTRNEFTPVMDDIANRPFAWDRIRGHSPYFEVLHGDNDPYLPLPSARLLADELLAPLTVISDGGHLNAAAGFTEFPLLLERVRMRLSEGVR